MTYNLQLQKYGNSGLLGNRLSKLHYHKNEIFTLAGAVRIMEEYKLDSIWYTHKIKNPKE